MDGHDRQDMTDTGGTKRMEGIVSLTLLAVTVASCITLWHASGWPLLADAGLFVASFTGLASHLYREAIR